MSSTNNDQCEIFLERRRRALEELTNTITCTDCFDNDIPPLPILIRQNHIQYRERLYIPCRICGRPQNTVLLF